MKEDSFFFSSLVAIILSPGQKHQAGNEPSPPVMCLRKRVRPLVCLAAFRSMDGYFQSPSLLHFFCNLSSLVSWTIHYKSSMSE